MYFVRPEQAISSSIQRRRRRHLLYVDDRANRLTDELLKRSDVAPVLLRFTTDPPLPLPHLQHTAHCQAFTFAPTASFAAEMTRLRDFLARNDIRLQGFLNHSEAMQILSQAIARDLGLPALSAEATLLVRDKLQMKRRFRELGFRTAEFLAVSRREDLRAFARRHGYPLILKPLDGFACIDAHLLQSASDVAAVDLSARGKWLVETFVPLREWEICALVQHGKVLTWFPSYMPAAPLQAANGAINANISVGPSEIAALRPLGAVVDRLVAGFDLQDGYLHMELFFEQPDQPVLGEIGFRLAGCEIPANHGLAYGFDIYHALIDIALGDWPAIPSAARQAAGDLLLPAAGGRVCAITPLADLLALPGVVEGRLRFQPGDDVVVRRASHFAAGHVHVVGANVAEVEGRMRKVLDAFAMATVAPADGPSIALFATAFGFGPVSKAVAVAQSLRSQAPAARLVYFGGGTDLPFAVASRAFNEVVAVDVDRPSNADDLLDRLTSFDVAVSIMNEALPPRWPPWHHRLVMVDSLAWLWPAPPPGVENAACYFVQDFMLPAERADAWRRHGIELVGPILHRPEDFARVVDESYVLLNFNGSASFIQPRDWFERVIQATLDCVLQSPTLAGRMVVVATNAEIAAVLASRNGSRVVAASFPIQRMGALMRHAEVVLSSPGITSTLEALQLGVPIGLLLPLNYSQMLLGHNYHARFGERSGLATDNFGAEYTLPVGLPEIEGVARTMACVDELLQVRAADIRSSIDAMLEGRRMLEPCDLLAFRLAPGLTDGAELVARRVLELAAARSIDRGGAL